MSNTLVAPELGRLWTPEAVTIGPAMRSGPPRYRGIVKVEVRDGQTGEKRLHEFGLSEPTIEGLANRWHELEPLQQLYASPEMMVEAELRRINRYAREVQVWHNERVNNGGAMVGTSFWGVSAGTTGVSVSSVAAPTRIGIAKNTFVSTSTHQSIGTGTGNATTNEFTTAGLSRTGAIAPTAWSAETSLDGTASLQIANTFTCTSGPQTAYGSGLFDASTAGSSNMFAEFLFAATVTLQTNDQLIVTWTCSF